MKQYKNKRYNSIGQIVSTYNTIQNQQAIPCQLPTGLYLYKFSDTAYNF
ncbi:MAG: hypothetical protein IPI59_11235 [Sphingobacteriales bacterium]|jgi:hypothetical protein|nr:hypothetical protein [Sphingobacteriales bacterium]MBP9141286.1 hypothetical protein [Chitinophagales bacterium]MDA0198691.1 hypothetical protein [Bacteroidota bacterium]MBK6889395.1 hypothetical protein [Sphingobacteriales bacterium]MBK7528104.1 hypothetical protein [Sphingobacteriales bacterium]